MTSTTNVTIVIGGGALATSALVYQALSKHVMRLQATARREFLCAASGIEDIEARARWIDCVMTGLRAHWALWTWASRIRKQVRDEALVDLSVECMTSYCESDKVRAILTIDKVFHVVRLFLLSREVER